VIDVTGVLVDKPNAVFDGTEFGQVDEISADDFGQHDQR